MVVNVTSVLLLATTLTVASYDISDYRKAFESQQEGEIIRCLRYLDEMDKRSRLEELYYASFLCIEASYSYNPYTKNSKFSKGYGIVNVLIKRNPSNAEMRIHRYMIEKNAPSFLISQNHQVEDKKVILDGYSRGDPLYETIIKEVK